MDQLRRDGRREGAHESQDRQILRLRREASEEQFRRPEVGELLQLPRGQHLEGRLAGKDRPDM